MFQGLCLGRITVLTAHIIKRISLNGEETRKFVAGPVESVARRVGETRLDKVPRGVAWRSLPPRDGAAQLTQRLACRTRRVFRAPEAP